MMARTKIVCTLGPASSDEDTLRGLLQAGLDLARLNFSHGTHEQHAETARLARRLATEERRPLAILQDLQGPRIRIGDLPAPMPLQPGRRVSMAIDPSTEEIPLKVPAAHLPACPAGQPVYVDGGAIELRVVAGRRDSFTAEVVLGGELQANKGVNLPGLGLHLPAVTPQDVSDLAAGLSLGVDYVAQSFVGTAADVRELRQTIERLGGDVPIVAKIERAEAVADIDAIIGAADAIMLARGDLGIELPPEQVPGIQKRIIGKAVQAAVPIITATQMLESMVHLPRPTRAEVSDVANAVLDGSDALMLSAETAIGRYAVRAVRMMQAITAATEAGLSAGSGLRADAPEVSVTSAVSRAAVQVAQELGASLLVASTSSGQTARAVSRCRPLTRILGVTQYESTYRRLTLNWGVEPVCLSPYDEAEEMIAQARQVALERGLVQPGALMVFVCGMPLGKPGRTNMLQVRAA
jgi:pyruvate kinase